MTIEILDGATLTATSGTPMVFQKTGAVLANGVVLANMGADNIRVRETLSLKARLSAFANNVWSNSQYEVVFTTPLIVTCGADDCGTQKFASIRVIVTSPAEATAAQLARLWNVGAQTMFDSELAPFRTTGSLPG